MEKYYEFGPCPIGKNSLWLRFFMVGEQPVKILAQSRGKPYQDIELSREELTLAEAACLAHVTSLRQDEDTFLFGDFKGFLLETIERIPNKDLKVEGLEEYRVAAKKLLGVLNG